MYQAERRLSEDGEPEGAGFVALSEVELLESVVVFPDVWFVELAVTCKYLGIRL